MKPKIKPLTKKAKGFRFVIVNGQKWQWNCNRGGLIVAIRMEDRHKIFGDASVLTGYTNPDDWIEDSHYNKARYASVTTKMVANWINSQI